MTENLSSVFVEIILFVGFFISHLFSPVKEIGKMSDEFLRYCEIFDN